MRKMLREHDEGTERLLEMTTRRSKLMQLMIKKDFKSFHMELRPQFPLGSPQPHQTEKHLSLHPAPRVQAITSGA